MNILQRRLQPSQRLAAPGVTDGDLLQRFVQERDEAAFELLVHRHGAMLLGLCRRMLRDAHEAEDAVQAAFLTLACRAAAVHQHRSLGSWLYKVAYRICLRAQRRVRRYSTLPPIVDHTTLQAATVDRQEEAELLAAALARLSDRLRTVVVLCYLHGKSSSEAAAELGCPVNTVATRLHRAREALRHTLGRHGVFLSGSVAAAFTTQSASALNVPALAVALARQARQLLTGASLMTLATPAVTRMMKGAQTMSWYKPLVISAVVLLVGGSVSWSLGQPTTPVAAQPPLKLDLVQPPGKTAPAQATLQQQLIQNVLKKVVTPPAEQSQRVVQRFDVDNDGTDDLAVYTTTSHGPMSSGFVHYYAKAINGAKLLRNGAPLPAGTPITVADLLHGVSETLLCHVGGSLMFPEKSYREFSSGPWWGQTAALGLAKMLDGNVQLGYVVLAVTELGEVTVKTTHLKTIGGNPVEVSLEPQDNDVADVKSRELSAQGDANKRYYLIEPRGAAPVEGRGLLIILPGGDGGTGFLTFIKRISKNALPAGQYLVAQPVAKKWSANQQITWPVDKNRVPGMKFTTEEFISAVIDDVAGKHKINPQRVFVLGWSSGGPAAYAASLGAPKVTGSFVAMSVFNPKFLPPLENAKGKAFFLYHSEEDRLCPFRMAKQAETDLAKQDAKVQLKTYEGGHGWHGNLFDDIRDGITWLEQQAKAKE